MVPARPAIPARCVSTAPALQRPVNCKLYPVNGSLTMNEHRIESDSPYLQALQDAWVSTLIAAVDTLPALPADLVD